MFPNVVIYQTSGLESVLLGYVRQIVLLQRTSRKIVESFEWVFWDAWDAKVEIVAFPQVMESQVSRIPACWTEFSEPEMKVGILGCHLGKPWR